ncbi:ATP-dependent DNA helicase PIF1-like protein [Tanacetum coccineum]|uniref:ATP-dependent DNA helicase PIF1-like protein n=1 Tax=Tanacetum coccineum TaxID=301880 RepID=A0ABQ5GGI6_9ASTR
MRSGLIDGFSNDSKGHYVNVGEKLKILNLVISKGHPNKVALTGYTEVLTWILCSYRKSFTMLNRKDSKSTAFIIGNLRFLDFKGTNVYMDNIDVDVTLKICSEKTSTIVLSVIPKGSRLTVGARPKDVTEIHEFAEWILKVEDGKLEEPLWRGIYRSIDLSKEILIDANTDPVMSIINFTYPNILDNINDPSYFQEKAILTPTNELVDNINEH